MLFLPFFCISKSILKLKVLKRILVNFHYKCLHFSSYRSPGEVPSLPRSHVDFLPLAYRYRLMLWVDIFVPFWDSFTQSAPTRSHSPLHKQALSALSVPCLLFIIFMFWATVHHRVNRCYCVSWIRTNYSGVILLKWEGVSERGSKPNFRGTDTKPIWFQDCWVLHVYDLGPDKHSLLPQAGCPQEWTWA